MRARRCGGWQWGRRDRKAAENGGWLMQRWREEAESGEGGERRAEKKDSGCAGILLRYSGRSDWIRTSDPLVPNQVRYQAAPRSAGMRRGKCRRGISGGNKLLFAIPAGRLPRHDHDLSESCPHKSAFFARDHCAVGLTILPCPVSSPALGSGGAYGQGIFALPAVSGSGPIRVGSGERSR